VIAVNPRRQKGIPQLKKAIEQTALGLYKPPAADFIDNEALASAAVEGIKQEIPGLSNYAAIHYLINHESFQLDAVTQGRIEAIEKGNAFNPAKTQAEEILQRYHRIRHVMQQSVSEPD